MKRILALVMVAGCAAQGERAQDGCPSDEICAPLDGSLYFVGAALGDEEVVSDDWAAPHATALGGRQVVRVLHGPFLTSPPFDRPFTAAMRGDALAVASQDGPDVGIVGVVPGSAYLRILQPGTGDLYDRILLPVAPAARASLAQPALRFDAPRRAGTFPDWVIWAGRDLPLVVAIEAADGERVVDDGMTVNGVSGRPWDLVTVRATPGPVTLNVVAGGTPMPATIYATDFATDVVVDGPAAPTGSGWLRMCFQAIYGGRRIYGAPYDVLPGTSTGEVQTAGVEEGCAFVRDSYVTVQAGNVARTFRVDEIPVAKASEAGGGVQPGAAPGERAAR